MTGRMKNWVEIPTCHHLKVKLKQEANNMKTYERTREQGTIETVAGNGEDRVKAIRSIVDRKQYAKVDGTMVDLFSASAIVQVYDALSAENKVKYSALPAGRMGIVAFKLLK